MDKDSKEATKLVAVRFPLSLIEEIRQATDPKLHPMAPSFARIMRRGAELALKEFREMRKRK